MTDNLTKYFRTCHLPWSEAVADDDIVRESPFKVGDIVYVSLKMDGENTSGYPSGKIHARSLDSANHPSRNYVKAYWQERSYNLPDGWRVCGENMFAKHSIFYESLKSYLYVFSIWDEKNYCLSLKDMLEWCDLLDLTTVDIIYHGPYDEKAIKLAFLPYKETHEGYVVRTENSFHYSDSDNNIAKYVRKNHVQTDEHWMHSELIPNKLTQKMIDNISDAFAEAHKEHAENPDIGYTFSKL